MNEKQKNPRNRRAVRDTTQPWQARSGTRVPIITWTGEPLKVSHPARARCAPPPPVSGIHGSENPTMQNQKRTRPTFEAFKRNHPERYAALVTTALKLRNDVVPHLKGKMPPLDWWEPRLGFLLTPAYERRQVLRGILDEICVEWGATKSGSPSNGAKGHSRTHQTRKIRRTPALPAQRTLDSFFLLGN